MRGVALGCAVLALAGCGGRSAPPQTVAVRSDDGWRTIATDPDRARIRGWRDAWVVGLAQARTGGAGADLAAQGTLFDPDRALTGPAIPDGLYRCRTFKLGSKVGGDGFTGYDWFRCRIADGQLTKLDGSQRTVGRIYPDTDSRSIYLGTLELGDETRAMRYARDTSRDMVGIVERIGPMHWRIAFPYPRYESVLDVLEIVPA